MISLRDVVNGQNKIFAQRAEDNRFKGDYEPIEFVKTDYDCLWLVDTNSYQDKLVESVVAIQDDDYYLLTATTTIYAGEKQVNYISQQLTLQGFNFFTKDLEEDISWVYDRHLQANGYDMALSDVIELGEFKPELNGSTILQFKDDEDNTHYLTVNKFGQLSKINKKLSARAVKPKISSAFS